MNELLKKILGKVFYAIFCLIFVAVVVELFFSQQVLNISNSVREAIFAGKGKEYAGMNVLRVAYPDGPVTLEPTVADPVTRQRLDNIYEALVKADRDLNIRPSLAVSFGLIDNYTWEFKLRSGVKFHDGSALDVEDVKASFDRAMSYPGSELTGLLSTIKDLQIEDDLNFKIITSDPDPLLLQRLSMILIVPSEYRDRKMETPVGTGSYEFDSWDVGKKITLKSFDGYWGEKSKFEKVEMYSVADKFDRVDMLINGDADLLAFVPYDGVDYVKENGFNIVSVPSLEVQFLLFNMRSNRLMSNIKNREFVSFSVNQKSLIDAIGGYARSVSQFVGSGIFGFSPYIPDHVYDFDAAAELAKETGLVGKTVQFHLGQGLTVLGDYLREKLGEMGVNVVVSYLNESDLLKSMESGKADIYFLGFKSGIGDSSSFLSFIPYSDGPYNYLGYKNEYVDKLIKGSLMEMNFFSRQNDLQEAMKIIVEEDVIGVPLFEYEVVYAFNDKVIINPRIDGIIYFDELIVN